jgi:hypothetical protein
VITPSLADAAHLLAYVAPVRITLKYVGSFNTWLVLNAITPCAFSMFAFVSSRYTTVAISFCF